MAADRFYTTASRSEAWMVTDTQTRYVRVIAKSSVTGEEDFCLSSKKTTVEDEAYIKGYAETGSWEIFFHLLSQMLSTMKRKKEETENFFKVTIN
jgi:hypothetical protein